MDRKIEKKIWTPKRIIGLILVVGILSLVGYGLFFADTSSKLNVETEKITIATVQRGAFQEFIPVTGTVLPINTIYLDAIEGGSVEEIFVEEGALVAQGARLLRLANTDRQLDIMTAENRVFDEMNALRNARLEMEQNRLTLRGQIENLDYQIQRQKRVFDRNTELSNNNLISQLEYEQSKDDYEYLLKQKEIALKTQEQDAKLRQAQIEQLEASVRRIQANVDIIKQKLANLVITAPVSGQLSSLNAEVGQSKASGERLGQIDVLDGFKVRAAIDEHYLARINIGQSGEFDFADGTFRLTIAKIYPEVRDGRFEADMEFVGIIPQGIKRGQTLRIRLELGDLSEVVLLPRGGFYQKTGGNWVYLVDEAGKEARKRSIKLGRQNPLFFEVLEGLQPGEKVIVSSYDSFGDVDTLILK